jgi:hypothetical protein
MGYRSSGRWIITGPADKVTAAWVLARLEVPPHQPDQGDGHATFDDFDFYVIGDRGYIRFEFDGWKWYPSYSEVRFYEQVWGYLSEIDGLSGCRVHLGEDNEVEEHRFGDDLVHLGVTFYDDEPTKPTTKE